MPATVDESLPSLPLTTFPSGPPGSGKATPPDQGVKIRLPRRSQVSRAAGSLNCIHAGSLSTSALGGRAYGLLGSQRQRFLVLEIRTAAGPSRHAQWVLRGGPYTVCITGSAGPCRVSAAVSEAARYRRVTANQLACLADRKPFPLRRGIWLLGDYRRTAWISIISLNNPRNNPTTGIHHEINARIRLRHRSETGDCYWPPGL